MNGKTSRKRHTKKAELSLKREINNIFSSFSIVSDDTIHIKSKPVLTKKEYYTLKDDIKNLIDQKLRETEQATHDLYPDYGKYITEEAIIELIDKFSIADIGVVEEDGFPLHVIGAELLKSEIRKWFK